MPLYTYKCTSCKKVFDRFLRLLDHDLPQNCECGSPAEKQLCAPAVRGDYAGYSCPITGKWVEGRRAHEENLKRHGCRVLESGETDSARRRVADEDAKLEAAIESTAEQFVASLPAVKQEKLASEMQAGVTATVVRQ